MSDLSKDPGAFNNVAPLDFRDVRASVAVESQCIELYITDSSDLLYVDEARALRDWLNKVLPNE